MESVNVFYVWEHDLRYVRPVIEGTTFSIKMFKYKYLGHAQRAVQALTTKLHLRVTDKALKISQKRKRI